MLFVIGENHLNDLFVWDTPLLPIFPNLATIKLKYIIIKTFEKMGWIMLQMDYNKFNKQRREQGRSTEKIFATPPAMK